MRKKSEVLKEMENLYSKIRLYNKKKSRMGLDADELQICNRLMAQYIKMKIILVDTVFDEYIFVNILNGRARSVYMEINREISWHGELLIEDEDIDRILDRYERVKEKEELRHKIAHLYNLLKRNLVEFREKMDNDFFVEISLLISDGRVEDFEMIEDHLLKRFDILNYLIEYKEEWN